MIGQNFITIVVRTRERQISAREHSNTSNKQLLITDLSAHSSIVPQKEKNKIHKESGRDNESNGAMHSYPKVEYTGTRLRVVNILLLLF